jgi:hypothetical protein
MRGERGGVLGSQPISIQVYTHGAQINFGDLTPNLTYAVEVQFMIRINLKMFAIGISHCLCEFQCL